MEGLKDADAIENCATQGSNIQCPEPRTVKVRLSHIRVEACAYVASMEGPVVATVARRRMVEVWDIDLEWIQAEGECMWGNMGRSLYIC